MGAGNDYTDEWWHFAMHEIVHLKLSNNYYFLNRNNDVIYDKI